MLSSNKRTRRGLVLFVSLLFVATMPLAAYSQDWNSGYHHRAPTRRGFYGGHEGRWWESPGLAQKIGLTEDQRRQLNDIFQQHRLKVIDLKASLEKQEAIIQPLIKAAQPDEAKVLAQVDAIAQARVELDKANVRVRFDLRKVLTDDQWHKLQTIRAERRQGERGHEGEGRHDHGGDDEGHRQES